MIDFDNRPWGRWEEYIFEPSYRVKRIVVYPGKRLSLQRHKLRAEVWVIVSGSGIMTLDDKTFPVKTGDVIQIPKMGIHRLENDSEVTSLVFIETQIGICPEDDTFVLSYLMVLYPLMRKANNSWKKSLSLPNSITIRLLDLL